MSLSGGSEARQIGMRGSYGGVSGTHATGFPESQSAQPVFLMSQKLLEYQNIPSPYQLDLGGNKL
jgi:hypothetical protein